MSHLQDSVLVLNRYWQAVNICTVRRAFTLLFAGYAKAIMQTADDFRAFDFSEWRDFNSNYNGEDIVGTVTMRLRVPRVILLLNFAQLPKKDVKFTRHNIYERDKDTCQYCGEKKSRKELNLDHVIPRDQNGPTTWENIVCACIECNTRKANRTPSQAGMRLIKKPRRPKWRPFVNVSISKVMHPEWNSFMDLAYWNVELGEELK